MYNTSLNTNNEGLYLSHQLVDVLLLINCSNADELEKYIRETPNLTLSSEEIMQISNRLSQNSSELEKIKREIFEKYQDSYTNYMIMDEIRKSNNLRLRFHLKLQKLNLSIEEENELFQVLATQGESECFNQIQQKYGEEMCQSIQLYFGDDYENIKSSTYDQMVALNNQIKSSNSEVKKSGGDYTLVIGSSRFFNTMIVSSDSNNEIGYEYNPHFVRKGIECAEKLDSNIRFHCIFDCNTAKALFEEKKLGKENKEQVIKLLEYYTRQSLNEIVKQNAEHNNIINVVELFNELVEYNKDNKNGPYEEVWKKYFGISIEEIMERCIAPNMDLISMLKQSGVEFMYNETLLQESSIRLDKIEEVYDKIQQLQPGLIDSFGDQMHFTNADLSSNEHISNLVHEFEFLKKMQDKGLKIESTEFDFGIIKQTMKNLMTKLKSGEMSIEQVYQIKQNMINQIRQLAISTGVEFSRCCNWNVLDNVNGTIVRENRSLPFSEMLGTMFGGKFQTISNMGKNLETVISELNVESNSIIDKVEKFSHPGFNYPSLDNIYSPEEIMQLQSNLKTNAQKYLQIVLQEYGTYIGVNPAEIISQDILKIELNGQHLLDTHMQEIKSDSSLSEFQKLKEINDLSMPLAHGGRTLDDKTIHIYPSFLLTGKEKLSIDQVQKKCDEIVLHEMLHFFIRPEYNENKEISAFVTEGLVDMCTRDIQKKYGINAEYTSNYTDNVVFLREALGNINNPTFKNQMIFKGSVDQVLSMTSTSTFDSKKEAEKIVAFQKEKDKEKKKELTPDFRKQVREFATKFPDHHDSIERRMMEVSANCSSKKEALTVVENITNTKLNESKQNEAKTEQTKPISVKRGPEVESASFTKRSESEVQIASQIKQKNTKIQKQNEQQRSLDKPKVKTLTKPTNNGGGSSSSGFVDTLILTLITGFVAGAIFMLVYSILK